MPGAFAHLTLVNLMKEPARLDKLGFTKRAAAALLDWFRFCELGAVSPDYPYLAVRDDGAAPWADLMHYERTGEMSRAGIDSVRALEGTARARAFAWLLGYIAHVSTDVTIHPVVELKVGPYAQNKMAHRVCEMHQDVYIWQRMNLGEIGLCEQLTSGILRCVDQEKKGSVDAVVKVIWEGMLRRVHPAEADKNPPFVDKWHAAFDLMVNKIGEEGNKLMPIARHVAVNCGLTYPALEDVDRKAYIDALQVPGGGTATYDHVFDRAMTSVGKAWQAAQRAVYQGDAEAAKFFGNWNLDTGLDENQRLVFWT
jgi:hypothetical protein